MTSSRFLPNPRCRPHAQNDLLHQRSSFLKTIRDFFHERGFLEVETPILLAYADPSLHLASFRTWYEMPEGEAKRRLFLRTSPEFAMKRLLAGGYPRIFQIGPFFRNAEDSPLHNPEFTGLEWYQADADYRLLMETTEAMCLALWPQGTLMYQGRRFDLTPPWERLSVHEAFARYAQITLPAEITRLDLLAACQQKGIEAQADEPWDDLFFRLFVTFVDPHLGQEKPTFLTDYPVELAALARAKPDAPHLAERVELYIAGLELANGYSELIDAEEQRRRWEAEAALRQARHDPDPFPVDPQFLAALQAGMPPCTGIAVGLDRLLMLYLDAPAIADILPFPFASYPPQT